MRYISAFESQDCILFKCLILLATSDRSNAGIEHLGARPDPFCILLKRLYTDLRIVATNHRKNMMGLNVYHY